MVERPTPKRRAASVFVMPASTTARILLRRSGEYAFIPHCQLWPNLDASRSSTWFHVSQPERDRGDGALEGGLVGVCWREQPLLLLVGKLSSVQASRCTDFDMF